MRLLILLQNAYRIENRVTRHADGMPLFVSGARAFENSIFQTATDKKLQKMIPFGFDIVYANASPVIGVGANSFYPYEENHVKRLIERFVVNIGLLCGKEARKAAPLLRKINIPFLIIPHPGARFISNDFCARVRLELCSIAVNIMELNNARDKF